MQLNGFRACVGDIGDVRPLFFLYYFLAQFEIKLFGVSWCRLLLKSERSKFCSGVHVQTCTSSFLSYLLIYWMWCRCDIPMNNNLTRVVYLWGREWEKSYTHFHGPPHVRRFKTESMKMLTLRWLMSYIYIYIYIYGAPILDVSRSHTTTQHSR